MKKEQEVAFIIEPLDERENIENKLGEITKLIESAGAEIYGYESQVIKEVTPATYVGKGKLEEIADKISETKVTFVVFDGELTPSQTINMSDAVGVKVIDRTTLILDIFALNANSSEGKLQVELAQLKYIYPRLKGKGEALSRLGGGIGTRGPGESQLETDRRHIRRRITLLEMQLEELKKRRELQKHRRNKNELRTVAIVGYTNTGKSTLLNALTGADVLIEDRLFATLDPTIRKLKLDYMDVLLVDTVGFVQNIPHDIIEAFKSTLELAVEADLILNVCAADDDWEQQLRTTRNTLSELNCKSKILTVVNKCDKVSDFTEFPSDALFISAKNGFRLDGLLSAINKSFADEYSKLRFEFPYDKIGKFKSLDDYLENSTFEYNDDGVVCNAVVKKINLAKFKEFLE